MRLCERNLSSGGDDILLCDGREGTSSWTTLFRAHTQLWLYGEVGERGGSKERGGGRDGREDGRGRKEEKQEDS